METFAYPVDAVSKGGREKAETYEPLWKIADRHRVLKVPEGREKKKKKKKGGKKRKRKILRYLEQTILPLLILFLFSLVPNFAWLIRRLRIATNSFSISNSRRREV